MQMDGAEIGGIDSNGDFITVTAPASSIESYLSTSLSYRVSKRGIVEKKAIRADKDLVLPADVAERITFLSLNSRKSLIDRLINID